MKKVVSGILLAAVLVSGVFFAVQTSGDDTAWSGERHPPIVRGIASFNSAY